MPIRHRRSFPPIEMPQSGLRGISRDFSRLFPCGGQVAYVLLTRAPVAGGVQQADRPAAPRLACVKPVASVHPEPGSNSSLLLSCCLSSFKKNRCRQPAPNECCFLLRSGCPVSYCAVKLIVFCCTCLGINGTNKQSLLFSCTTCHCKRVKDLSFLLCSPALFPESECKVTPIF